MCLELCANRSNKTILFCKCHQIWACKCHQIWAYANLLLIKKLVAKTMHEMVAPLPVLEIIYAKSLKTRWHWWAAAKTCLWWWWSISLETNKATPSANSLFVDVDHINGLRPFESLTRKWAALVLDFVYSSPGRIWMSTICQQPAGMLYWLGHPYIWQRKMIELRLVDNLFTTSSDLISFFLLLSFCIVSSNGIRVVELLA